MLGTTATAVRPYLPADLVPVEVDGRAALCPPDQVGALTSADPTPGVVRLLGPSDPYLQGRDREALVPDRARRSAVWRSLGPPGVVVAGGEAAGTRRARQQGTAPEITVEPFRPLVAADRPALDEETGRAGRRACGCRSGEASPTLGGRTFLRVLLPADRDPWSSRALRTSRRAGLQ
ncbi:MAG: hypothetical protein V7633_5008 [Pseudonocardia sp.]